MITEFGFCNEWTNTNYAPLAALSAYYQQKQWLKGLSGVNIPVRTRDYSPADKLTQVLLSILADCETLVEVNSKLKQEQALAHIWQWPGFADQSTLSRTLDELTPMNISQLQRAVRQIWRSCSQVRQHDWRRYLWLDFDLSGLPCGPQAQASQKGFFSGKKTAPADS